MRAFGFEQAGADQAGNAVGVLGDGARQIVLLGHIDTVPGEIPVRLEKERLYGRGAVDAKGPLAAFVDAAATVGPQPGWQIVVIGAVDEERDSTGARHVAEHYRPDYAVIGEPTGWERIGLGYKGSATATLRIERPAGHSAGQLPSAPESAFQVWEAFQGWTQEYNQGKERLFDQLLPALRGFHSGTDGLTDWAELEVGARLPPELAPAAYYARLGEFLRGTAPADLRLTPRSFAIPAYKGEKNHPLGRALLRSIRSQGGQPGYVLKTGTADINVVAPAWNCPALVYGPGDSSLDHTPAEHILLPEYHSAVAVLCTVLRELTGG